jgi:ubiquinone/menaquinone biosynthesis C-methylase UbiE
MGDLAVMTARRVGASGFVLATDISADMLNLAAETVREAGFTNVEIQIMDAENIELAPASFNAALCRSALMLFPNAAKALVGVYRALKPSGKFAVTVWSTAEKNPFHKLPLSIASRLAKIPLPDSPGCSFYRARECSKTITKRPDSATWLSEQFQCDGISHLLPKP